MILSEAPFTQGFTAEIYKWENDCILKLYHAWMNPDAPELEAAALNAAFQAGIQVPQVKGIIEVSGRHGIILERINGYNLSEYIRSFPYKLIYYARQFAELFIDLHSISAPFLRSQKKFVSDIISTSSALQEDLKLDLLCLLDYLPNNNRLCHGDFHWDNILITSKGLMIIDWEKSTSGNPAADLANTNLFNSNATKSIPYSHFFYKTQLLLFHYASNNHYRRLSPESFDQMYLWMPIMKALKLADNPLDQKKYLENIVRDLHKNRNFLIIR